MSNQSNVIDLQPFILQFLQFLRSCQIGKFVEKLIIVFHTSRREKHRVQILFWLSSLHFFVKSVHLHINQLFTRLNCLRTLVIEAPGHQDNLDQNDMKHISPSDRILYVEFLCVVRYNWPVKCIVFPFCLQSLNRLFGSLRLLLSLLCLQKGISDQKCRRTHQHNQ